MINRDFTYQADFPPLPARPMIALQPSRVTPQSNTTVASFSKDKISYHTVPLDRPIVKGNRKSVFRQTQKTLDVFKNIDSPMTVQNFKNVDLVVNRKGKGKEIVKESPEQPLASSSSASLAQRISSPADETLIWNTDDEMLADLAPPTPKMVEEPMTIEEDPYNFDESDVDEDGMCP